MTNWLMTIKKKTYKIFNFKKSDNTEVSCISLTWLYTCVRYGVPELSVKKNLKACFLSSFYIHNPYLEYL